MANIKDVAKEAGVSVTTVSRVMNDRGYISEKTRKKVYDAMEKIGYHPNELAKNFFR
ncbi:LacI family DNA-binding transcriptional regulator, partial [Romboutsia timonensis]